MVPYRTDDPLRGKLSGTPIDSTMRSASSWMGCRPLAMRRRVALPILPRTRFPAPFGGSLRSSVATKPTATFSGPPYGLRLLFLLGNWTNLLNWKARALRTAFRP
jgi:hypothetical protein